MLKDVTNAKRAAGNLGGSWSLPNTESSIVDILHCMPLVIYCTDRSLLTQQCNLRKRRTTNNSVIKKDKYITDLPDRPLQLFNRSISLFYRTPLSRGRFRSLFIMNRLS